MQQGKMHSAVRRNGPQGDLTIARRNAIHPTTAGLDLTETAAERTRIVLACTNLAPSVKYKPLPTGSSKTESEPWPGFQTANQNSCARTNWIPTNAESPPGSN